MLGDEVLAGHRGPHPGPIGSRHRRAHRQGGCRIDRRDAVGDLERVGVGPADRVTN
jgi:hypothetical protein